MEHDLDLLSQKLWKFVDQHGLALIMVPATWARRVRSQAILA
jgi:hypothetical protein